MVYTTIQTLTPKAILLNETLSANGTVSLTLQDWIGIEFQPLIVLHTEAMAKGGLEYISGK